MQERIKTVRKALRLTQTAFGERIGVKGNTVTGWENGLRAPSDAIINSICREFGVNEEWLRTGSGTPFKEKASNIIQFSKDHPEMTDIERAIMEAFFALDERQKEVFVQYCLNVAEAYKTKGGKNNTAAARSGDRVEVVAVSEEEENNALPPDYSGDV